MVKEMFDALLPGSSTNNRQQVICWKENITLLKNTNLTKSVSILFVFVYEDNGYYQC